MIGVGLVGAIFYAMVSAHFMTLILGKSLGPYSDSLGEFVLESSDPEKWRAIAKRHGVALLVEPISGPEVAFDAEGESLSPEVLTLSGGLVRAPRESPDGKRVTFYWARTVVRQGHRAMLGSFVLMLLGIVGSAFWFLHRQLKPLTWLHEGVDAVAAGDLQARVPIVSDDEIGQVAVAFNVMASRVGQMLDDREKLLGDVSHELRSPIARMKVALEFMPGGDKRESLANDLREMEHLITVLLEREGLRSRASALQAESVDLTALVVEACARLSGQEPGVDYQAATPVTLDADPSLLMLLVQNLIGNGLKFSLPDSLPISVSLDARSDMVRLCVSDDGIGIPPGSEERVFEPFAKLDPSRGHGVGHGIGLDLCRRIVELHGGSILLKANEPRGTVAEVSLPFARKTEIPA